MSAADTALSQVRPEIRPIAPEDPPLGTAAAWGDRFLAVERDARTLAAHPDPSPERLHRFHRDLRRLRIELRVLHHVLGPAGKSVAEDLGRRLKRLARLVGEVRD